LKPVDAAALKKQYGADELIDAIVGPVNATIEQINKMLPAVQQTQARSQRLRSKRSAGRSTDFSAARNWSRTPACTAIQRGEAQQ
jgi:hypothetical protein